VEAEYGWWVFVFLSAFNAFPFVRWLFEVEKKSHGNVVGASKVRWRLLWWIWSVGSDPVM